MSRQINQPINQVRLTNVAVVRCHKGGKRFEIACYRNKVLDFRAGLETDLSEVLQTDRIFTNVSKGQFAKASDLAKAFGTKDEEAIATRILQEGNSLQVSDLERTQQLQNTLSQIATWVANNCVHPTTNRPYTTSQIKQALGKNYNVQPHKALKKQYLDAVKFLKTVLPIERAKMELALQYDSGKYPREVPSALARMDHRLVSNNQTEKDNQQRLVVQVDPSLYRELQELAKAVEGELEIVEQVVTQVAPANNTNTTTTASNPTTSTEDDFVILPSTTTPLPTTAIVEDDEDGDNDQDDENTPTPATEAPKPALDEGAAHENDEEDDDEEENEPILLQPIPSRKDRRKQAKKSKKAKRREKEEMLQQQQQQETVQEAEARRREQVEQSAIIQQNAAAAQPLSTTKSCNTCGGSFATAAEYRAHFRSDWHRYNQKLKLKGVAPVSEREFLLCDADSFFGMEAN